jgi:mono/diheme cytochrome c family protein
MSHRVKNATTASAVVVMTTTAITMAHAQRNGPTALDSGKDVYDSHCAVCHGTSGAGDGPYVGLLNIAVPDLTTLAKRNGGMFPSSRVYDTIDGTLSLPAHGTRTMPIWGQIIRNKAAPRNRNPQSFVRSTILSLVLYIQRLQAK